LTPEDEVAREIERARVAARARADVEGAPYAAPPAPAVERVPPLAAAPASDPPALPAPPDATAVNTSWRAPEPGAGPLARLGALLERLLRPRLDAQQRFAADQVRLDNELLAYVCDHFAASHRHYDRILGAQALRMNEVDRRHLELQERLVVHVHELVRRVDLVLEASERSRLSAEADLRRLQARVEELERRLGRG